MSYHDGYNPNLEGIAVVNPLIEQQDRLTRLEKFLEKTAKETTDDNLKKQIAQILKNK